ncbi:MAG TPA: TetR/AcrR family transcriptional regulator [Ktedonobacteraceae bacterium]|nr:TetR/AcrR family transcriptional regulator [Ktedonobacteraceae bacterium]
MASNKNKKTDRRAELLNIAREIFAEKGFEATTISEIVARAGVAQGTFYWYFPSKNSLMVALAKEMRHQIKRTLLNSYSQSEDLQTMIEKSVTGAFRIMEQYRDVLTIIRFSATHWLGTPSDRERVFSSYYSLIAEMINREQAKGVIADDINGNVMAVLIVGTVYYAAEECYVYNSTIPVEIFIAQCTHYIQRALGLK